MTNDLARVRVGELSIGYRQAGRGPALVLLHGMLCDSRCWRRQLADLADEFRVIAWDAPGAGASTDPPEAFALQDWSRCLADFLDALEIDRACLVGLSWGGVLAQAFLCRHPARVSRLVLADTNAGWKGSLPPAAVAQRLAVCERDSRLPPERLVPRWLPEMFSDAASADLLQEMSAVLGEFHPRGFRLMARSLALADTTRLLARIQVPTLLLWGEVDRRSPLALARQMADAIPGARLRVIPGAGHVSNMERPEHFDAEIRRFLVPA